jgi:photosystem II stability/assembly factor-like uncharacterized protein
MKSLLPLLTATCLVLAGISATSAQEATFDRNVINGMEWRNIGPKRGGRSLGIAGSPGRKNEYYFGAVGGGLWKTVDGGLNWSPVTDGQLTSSSVGAVAVAETNPDVVYIGTGETQLRGNIMQGDGVYKSTDAGETWEHMGLADTQAISRIRVHPTDPDVVYVAALGHPYGPNEERGVFRSRDGGVTWEKVLFVSEKAGAADLIIDRTQPGYAVCLDLGGVSDSLEDVGWRWRQRPVQVHGRRRQLGRADRQAGDAGKTGGQDRHHRFSRRLEPPVGDRGGRRGRRVPLR